MADQENLVEQETDVDNNKAVDQGRVSLFTDHAEWNLHANITRRLPFLHTVYIWTLETNVQVQMLTGSVRTLLMRKLMQLACFLFWSVCEPNTLVGCRQEDDMGELNFNSYDAALLEGGDEEEASAMLDTRQQAQEDQEVLQCWRANWASANKMHSQKYLGWGTSHECNRSCPLKAAASAVLLVVCWT